MTRGAQLNSFTTHIPTQGWSEFQLGIDGEAKEALEWLREFL